MNLRVSPLYPAGLDKAEQIFVIWGTRSFAAKATSAPESSYAVTYELQGMPSEQLT